MANLIAVQKAIEEVGAEKIITFHSRVRLAQEFASNERRGIAYHLPDYDVRHVNGEQSSGDRAEVIRAFSNAEKSLLTNARCLTEGINIPAVDMVAFIDPRQSRIDITQAVGRAMRKPRGPTAKTVGYVVVPVFAGMSDEDSLEDAIKSEKFEAVVDVLNALQEHDEELVDILRELKERKGLGEPFNPRRLSEKIEVIGPRVDLDRLTTSISVEIAEGIGSSWDEWYGRLRNFVDREGHCSVPNNYDENGHRLGRWVGTQRERRRSLSDIRRPLSNDRRERLDELGFVWDIEEAAWEEGFNYLRLSDEQRQRLEGLGFVWDPLEDAWQEGIGHLKLFRNREGHCRVSYSHMEGTFKLGQWVSDLRKRSVATPIRRKVQLDELGFIWDVSEEQWQSGFTHLEAFRKAYGHCLVPQQYQSSDGYRLGVWVAGQPAQNNNMSAERRQRLDEIGFVWRLRKVMIAFGKERH